VQRVGRNILYVRKRSLFHQGGGRLEMRGSNPVPQVFLLSVLLLLVTGQRHGHTSEDSLTDFIIDSGCKDDIFDITNVSILAQHPVPVWSRKPNKKAY
jgi:hypothetical protein